MTKKEKSLLLTASIAYTILTLCFVFILGLVLKVKISLWYLLPIGGAALLTTYYFLIATVREMNHCREMIGVENQTFKIIYFEQINEQFVQLKFLLHQIVEDFNQRKNLLVQKESDVKKNKEIYDQWLFDLRKIESHVENEKAVTRFLLDHMSDTICISELDGTVINSNRPIKYIGDFIDVTKKEMAFFQLKDYNEMMLKSTSNKDVRATVKRVYHNGTLKHLIFLFVDMTERDRLKRHYLKQCKEIQMMYDLTKIISGRQTIHHMLQEALESVTRSNQLYAAVIRLHEPNQGLVLTASYGLKRTSKLIPVKSVTQTHVGYTYLKNESLLLNDQEDLFMKDESAERLLKENKKLAYVPLKTHKKKIGVLSIISNDIINEEDLNVYVSAANLLAVAIEKINLIDELKFNYFKTVESFVTATEIKTDRYGGHSRRVAIICKLIAEKMNLNASEVDDIYISGLLHDVGKLTYSDSSLGDVDDEDDHSVRGRKMVEKVGLGHQILEGIEYHHHNYYDRDAFNILKEQPYYAQIIRVANDYDMKLMRFQSLSIEEVFDKEIAPFSGTLYAPYFVRILKHFITEQHHSIAQIYANEATDES